MKASKCKLDVRAGAVMWATLCIFSGRPSQALPQEFFYQGKTITVISGREPGGLGDLRHRAILPYLKKHIPGQPTIVTEYMPGGGGRTGEQITLPNRSAGRFDHRISSGRLHLGSSSERTRRELPTRQSRTSAVPNPRITTCFSRESRPIWHVLDRSATSGIRIGGQSVGHTIYTLGRLFAYILRLKEPDFITEYSGPEDQALLRGEVDARAMCSLVARAQLRMDRKKLVDVHSSWTFQEQRASSLC